MVTMIVQQFTTVNKIESEILKVSQTTTVQGGLLIRRRRGRGGRMCPYINPGRI
jgi:hypothetical protein